MSTEIRIDENQNVSAVWTGKRGGGSLFQISAEGNCKNANKLGFDELLEVFVCARMNGFPVPGFTASREKTVEVVRSEGWVLRAFHADNPIRTKSVGELRRAIVYECGDSMNGPLDGWLSWLAEQKSKTSAIAC